MHFVVGDERAMDAGGQRGTRRQIEHVAVAEQGFSAALVEDGARIDLGRHLKGDAARDIGLDEAGDDIHRGTLRGEDEVDAGGAGFLRETRDQLLDLLADDHHHVGELIDDDDDERQRLKIGNLRLVDARVVGRMLQQH